MELHLSYPTHDIILETKDNSQYTKVTNYVQGQVYNDMVQAIISDKESALSFVARERVLLNNFLQSLLSIHNENEYLTSPIFFVFKDDTEYYMYCLVNDIEYENQAWFNTAFIKTDIYTALLYIKDASIKLISLTYPQFAQHPKSIIADWVTRAKDEKEKYKYNPDDYKSFLENNEIDRLYHFTSIRNLESIKKIGLCSNDYLEQLGVLPDYVSSSDSRKRDKDMGLGDYVRFSFEHEGQMLIKKIAQGDSIANYKILEVSPMLIFLKGTKYSKYNTLYRDAIISDNIQVIENLPFPRFHKKKYFQLDEEEKHLYGSEVLVKHNVPPIDLLNL